MAGTLDRTSEELQTAPNGRMRLDHAVIPQDTYLQRLTPGSGRIRVKYVLSVRDRDHCRVVNPRLGREECFKAQVDTV
jgi:hypothetical protein